MKLRDSQRVPLLLLGCLVTALVFPRACAGARVGAGALLPGTAELTGSTADDPAAAFRENHAALAFEIARLEEELAARPAAATGPLADVQVVRHAPPRPVAIAARVRHRDASSARRSILLDAGSDAGVAPGNPVIHGGSLVAMITTASAAASRAVRVDDPSAGSVFPAVVLAAAESGDRGARGRGVARGTGDGNVMVSFLRPGDARAGDLVVTGPGHPTVPEGLVLGEVVSFDDDDRDGSWTAEVRPLRDLDTLVAVLVLLPAPVAVPESRR